MKYPIYRKFRNGKEFHKITAPDRIISVLVTGYKNGYRIITTGNNNQIQSALDPEISVSATMSEFERAYNEAMWQIKKSNTVV
ncbi:MAG: hypothetical protein KF862_07495 [Chitinophagaceae bacterium]|nr:hypothetical protein [Chitinophagaceae bacterium]